MQNKVKYWAVGTNEKIDDIFLAKNKWWTDYPNSEKEGIKHRNWIKNKVNIGDKVALKTRNIRGKSLKIFAIGKVLEKFDDNSGFDVEWKALNPPIITSSTFGQTSTVREVKNREAINEIFNLDEEPQKRKEKNNMNTKNIILYGSPGVGKTHNTNKLIRFIEDGKGDREIFEAIKLNEKSDSVDISDIKERVKFVTFHQSFGYEDFIEGFRPNEEGNIELVDGVFKIIARQAQDNLDNVSKEKKFDFENFLNAFVNSVESSEKFELEQGLSIEVSKKSNGDFQSFRLGGRVKHQSLTKDIIKRDFDAYLQGNITHYQEIKPTYESQSPSHGNAPYYFKLYGVMKKFLDTNKEKFQAQNTELKNYYLVIDEINRGNISKIFGELITLIEEDKRDNLEVTLPYSKQPFKIPSNLYIIGTMNSTDKSIALIDIALRRRFTFLKMKPNDVLITFPKAKDIFIALNKKITEDLGEDYQIGHSYFMKIKSDDDLGFVLEYKIIPLLEEYYYGDDRFDEIVKFCKLDRGDN